MDMFKRLSTADSEIIDILLSRGELLTALRYVKATGKVDTVSARQFLEAAANEDDKCSSTPCTSSLRKEILGCDESQIFLRMNTANHTRNSSENGF